MSVEFTAILCVGVPIKVTKDKVSKPQFDPDTGLPTTPKTIEREFTVVGESTLVEGVLGDLDTLDVIYPDYETYVNGMSRGVLGKPIAECEHGGRFGPMIQVDETKVERLKLTVREELKKLGVEEEPYLFLLQNASY